MFCSWLRWNVLSWGVWVAAELLFLFWNYYIFDTLIFAIKDERKLITLRYRNKCCRQWNWRVCYSVYCNQEDTRVLQYIGRCSDTEHLTVWKCINWALYPRNIMFVLTSSILTMFGHESLKPNMTLGIFKFTLLSLFPSDLDCLLCTPAATTAAFRAQIRQTVRVKENKIQEKSLLSEIQGENKEWMLETTNKEQHLTPLAATTGRVGKLNISVPCSCSSTSFNYSWMLLLSAGQWDLLLDRSESLKPWSDG